MNEIAGFNPTAPTPPTPPSPTPAGGNGRVRQQTHPAASPPPADHPTLRRLRESTDALVGQVFFGALLAQMRGSPLKGKYGHGGRGEEVFAAQLDLTVAERAGRGQRAGLSETLYRHLARQQERMIQAEQTRQEAQT